MSNQVITPVSGSAEPSLDGRLDSWKEIAAYLRREVRTVQRWEKSSGLPVHRLQIGKQGPVYAYKTELDARYSDRRRELEFDSAGQDARSFFDTRKIRPWAVSAAVVLIAMLSVGAYLARNNSFFRSHSVPPKIKLAVLPFADLAADPDQKYFSAGLTYEMTTRLGTLDPQRLGVIGALSSSVVDEKPIADIGRAVNVQYALEGSVRRDGNHVRIDVQLIQVSDQTQLWANSYERDLNDILSVQDDIGTAVADKIHLALNRSGAKSGATTPKRIVNPDAYEAYLRGRFYWTNRGDLHKSIAAYQQAVREDPQYARAYAGLASAYALLGQVPYDDLSPSETKPKAREAAEQALHLDPELAEAHAVLANVAFSYDWNFDLAEREFQRAITLGLNDPTAHLWYGHFCIVRNRLWQALEESSRTLELDPILPLFNTVRAEIHYYAQNYEAAIEQARRTIDQYPNYPLAYIWLGSAYRQKKMYPEALDSFSHGRKLSGDHPAMIALYGHAQAVAGNAVGARIALAELQRLAQSRYVSPLYFAAIYLGLGEKSTALDWLDRAYRERTDRLVYLGVDPIADPLRGEPRFAQLLQKIGIQ